jgi:hypothetical protein
MAAGVSAAKRLVLLLVVMAGSSLAAQEQRDLPVDAENAVGLTLQEVFALYGEPDTVHTVRGVEEWQDDVVFVYTERKIDLYIYKDRVWQVCVQAALGLKKGDRKETALRILAGNVEDKEAYLQYHYPNTVWPKFARFNLDTTGRISVIYVYRPDL